MINSLKADGISESTSNIMLFLWENNVNTGVEGLKVITQGRANTSSATLKAEPTQVSLHSRPSQHKFSNTQGRANTSSATLKAEPTQVQLRSRPSQHKLSDTQGRANTSSATLKAEPTQVQLHSRPTTSVEES